jgi:hypothetical protein
MLCRERNPAAAVADNLDAKKRTISIDVGVPMIDFGVLAKFYVVEIRDDAGSDFSVGERHGSECDA